MFSGVLIDIVVYYAAQRGSTKKSYGLVRPKDNYDLPHEKSVFDTLQFSIFFSSKLKFEKLAQEMRCLRAKQFNQYKAFTQGIMLLMYDLTCFMYCT